MEELKEQIKDEKNLKFLGKGQFGKVYKLEYQGKEYAIKKISRKSIEDNKNPGLGDYLKNALQREINILKKMSEYENSVKFYGYLIDDYDYILFLEFCDSDLQKLLKEKGKFSISEIQTLMEGLNKPFKYMHNNGILHRDIKPENILIKFVDSSKANYIPKIGDYGISRELDNGKATTIVGTPRYMSPEVLIGEDEYTDKSDLFSIGTMIYELYFNSFPFILPFSRNKDEINKNYNTKKKEDCQDKLLDDLLNKLLKYDPDERISWEDYFRHPFFSNKEVDDLAKKVDNLKIYDERNIKLYIYMIMF